MEKKKKLTRSRSSKMLGGVCGGVAEYFSVDPSVVRTGYAIFTVFTLLISILIYLIMWLIVPEKKENS